MMSPAQNTIQFILDDQIVGIDFEKQNLSPTTTVLNYLRSLATHKGVKEGLPIEVERKIILSNKLPWEDFRYPPG